MRRLDAHAFCLRWIREPGAAHVTEPAEPEAIVQRLTELSRLIEEHRTAAFLLKAERDRLRWRLRRSDWRPPEVSRGPE